MNYMKQKRENKSKLICQNKDMKNTRCSFTCLDFPEWNQ